MSMELMFRMYDLSLKKLEMLFFFFLGCWLCESSPKFTKFGIFNQSSSFRILYFWYGTLVSFSPILFPLSYLNFYILFSSPICICAQIIYSILYRSLSKQNTKLQVGSIATFQTNWRTVIWTYQIHLLTIIWLYNMA